MARGVSGDVQVGFAQAAGRDEEEILLVRLQAPRFFVDRDQVTLSANVHNYLSAVKSVRVELVTDNGVFTLARGTPACAHAFRSRKMASPVSIGPSMSRRQATDPRSKSSHSNLISNRGCSGADLPGPGAWRVEKFVVQSGVLHDGGEATLDLLSDDHA